MYNIILIISIILVIVFIIIIILLFNINNVIYNCSYAPLDSEYEKPIIHKNMLTKDRCNEIINYCIQNGTLIDSPLVSGNNKNIRNSQQYWLSKDNSLAQEMCKFISLNYNIKINNMENIQIVRYKPGQYFKPHHDAYCVNDQYRDSFMNNGGQRIKTFLIYLNSDFEDGETNFPLLKLKLKPDIGDAIIFNTIAKNTLFCHPLALHEGLPVKSGEKWVMNIWVRENKTY